MLLVLSAGSNAAGQLANGTTEDRHTLQPVTWTRAPDPSSKVKKIVCGANFTVLLLYSGELWGSGDGSNGRFGSIQSSLEFTPLSLLDPDIGEITNVAAGWETLFVVIERKHEHDLILSAGSNDFGDLGTNDPAITGPHHVAYASLFSDVEGTDYVLRVVDIVSCTHHTVALISQNNLDGTSSRTVVGWGASRHGQLGPNIETRCTPPVRLHLRHVTPPISIAVGNQHTIILHEDGKFTLLGSNKHLQLDLFPSPRSIETIQCTWNGTYVSSMKAGGKLEEVCIHCYGSNRNGQLGVEDPEKSANTVNFPVRARRQRALQISGGSEHLLALTADSFVTSEVWGWGWNEHGTLGLGHTNDVCQPQKIWPRTTLDASRYDVESVWAGCGTTWIVLSEKGSEAS